MRGLIRWSSLSICYVMSWHLVMLSPWLRGSVYNWRSTAHFPPGIGVRPRPVCVRRTPLVPLCFFFIFIFPLCFPSCFFLCPSIVCINLIQNYSCHIDYIHLSLLFLFHSSFISVFLYSSIPLFLFSDFNPTLFFQFLIYFSVSILFRFYSFCSDFISFILIPFFLFQFYINFFSSFFFLPFILILYPIDSDTTPTGF